MSWYPNGQLHTEKYYLGGRCHGPVTVFYESGQICETFRCLNGLMCGVHKQWSENGDQITETTYYMDKITGTSRLWYSGNVLQHLAEYFMGRRHGIHKEFYPSGNIQRQSEWNFDKQCGQDLSWSDDGILESSFSYKNGKLHGETITFTKTGKKRVITYKKGRLLVKHAVLSRPTKAATRKKKAKRKVTYCSALTLANTPCTYKAKPGSTFCGVHKNYLGFDDK
jgi:antitoxin component YwqK of YwqJK toxin-antitoxin module